MALNAKTDPSYSPKRINGKFAPGVSGNPGGSLEATRRSFNKDFLLALATDFKQHGASAIASLAARPEKREYSRQFGSHPGNPGLNHLRDAQSSRQQRRRDLDRQRLAIGQIDAQALQAGGRRF